MKSPEPGRSMRIDEDVLDRVRAVARKERRSIKEQVAYFLVASLEQYGAKP